MKLSRLLLVLILAFSAGAARAQCVATEARPPGNHYKPIKNNAVNVGRGFQVSGHVRREGDCTPIAGARVGHWQPNAKGVYDEDLRAYMTTDREGRYKFQTEIPGTKPQRIHFMIIAPGYKTLITEWVGGEIRRDQVEANFILTPIEKTNPVK